MLDRKDKKQTFFTTVGTVGGGLLDENKQQISDEIRLELFDKTTDPGGFVFKLDERIKEIDERFKKLISSDKN